MIRHSKKDLGTFNFLEHTADIKVEVKATSLECLLETCILALSNYMARGKRISRVIKKKVLIEGNDLPSILYRLLDEMIFLADAQQFVVGTIKVAKTPSGITAELWGDKTRNYTLTQVKAATYAEMILGQTKKGWKAQFVLDV
jgi:SHS2 domain-containing protein